MGELRRAGEDGPRTPVLVFDAGYHGTLAAVRTLGRAGVPITVADPSAVAAASWSRHATRRVRCPSPYDSERFLDWLLRFGDTEPRHVLQPTSDEIAFLVAANYDAIASRFTLLHPGLEPILRVLDKGRLYAHAAEAGLETPRTWFPTNEAEVAQAGREAGGPLLVKPRMQVLLNTHSKGVIVRDMNELWGQYDSFARKNVYGRALLEHCPSASKPMLQAYHPDAKGDIYVLAAFCDRTQTRFGWVAGRKVLQRPRKLGVGLCFEGDVVDPALTEGVERLCRATGYYGLFQLEFIRSQGRYLLIDFNPRLYNQLALDVARGLPLPQMVYAAALGDEAEVARLLAMRVNGEGVAFCNSVGLEMLIGAQRLSGKMSADEARHWRDWRSERRAKIVDPVVDRDDPLPLVADVATQIYGAARHPRAFLRSIVLDR